MTNKPIITMFEAYGAGALDLGPKLAERFGVEWITQSTSSETIEALDPKGTGRIDVKAFFNSIGFADMGSVDLLESPSFQRAKANARMIREMLKDGGVVLGRNATVIMLDAPNSLHVKLEGKTEDRIARAAKKDGIPLKQAALRQMREDSGRAEMSIELWNWDPRTTKHYDVVINTSTYGLDGALEMIVAAYNRKHGTNF